MLKSLAFQHPDHRRARLFRNGKNQAVRIPKEFEFPVHEVILRRKGKSFVRTNCQSPQFVGNIKSTQTNP